MDKERAETHLRRLVEAALRDEEHTPRVRAVIRALTSVHAMEEKLARDILADMELATTVRRPQPRPGVTSVFHSRHLAYGSVPRITHLSSAVRTAPATSPPPPPPPSRLVPLLQPLRFRTSAVRGELFLLACAQVASSVRLACAGTLREKRRIGRGHRALPRRPAALDAINAITATDESGAVYQLRSRSSRGSGSGDWSGHLQLVPDPPRGARRLELSAGGERLAVIRLDQQAAAPDITVVPDPLTPGEYHVHRLAAEFLSGWRDAAELPAVIAALRAAQALPPDSEVPAELDRLLRHETDGIPEQWRLAPPAAGGAAGCAALAISLPEIDGVRLSLFGMTKGRLLYHAAGVRDTAGMDLDLPLLWLRDDAGWHATAPGSWGGGNGEAEGELDIVPPLRRGGWVEVLAVGQNARLVARLPVTWRNFAS